MPLDNKDRENILKGRFTLDCPLLELVPQLPSPVTNAYSGSGYLSLNEKDFFEVKLYQPHPIPLEEVFVLMHWKAGEIIDKKFYYRLKAVDLRGREWVADGILPDRNSGPAGAVIVGKAAKLVFKEDNRSGVKSNYLQIVFGADIKFPPNTGVKTEREVGGKLRSREYNLCVAKFKVCNIQFAIEPDAGATILTAQSDAVQFDDKVINCIIDAFSFVTGSIHQWSIIEIGQRDKIETRLQASAVDLKQSRIGPPIQDYSPNNDVWTLFERFLSYGMNSTDADGHPLGWLVRSVIASGKSALEVEALTLSVSVESLLTSHFSELCVKNEKLEENIEKATNLVKTATGLDESFRNRLLGAIAATRLPRAKDYLFSLTDQKLIEPSLVEVYGKLRNPSAHGVAVNWAEIQSYLNQCSAVLVLFYQLIFMKVGYTGPYTDYGTYGWPRKDFHTTLS